MTARKHREDRGVTDGDKERAEHIRLAIDRVNHSLDDISKRAAKAIERFKKERANRPKGKNAVNTDPEFELQLEGAQIGIRNTLGAGSWFFENKEIVARGPQLENEQKLYEDPVGLFEAKAVIEEAKKGDRFARYALHNKLILEIDDDFPIIEEYKKYLIWMLRDTREGKRRRGRHPKLNHVRDRWICEAVDVAVTHGFRLTRNRGVRRAVCRVPCG